MPVVAPRLPCVTAVAGEEAPFLYEPAAANGLTKAMERSLTEPLERRARPCLRNGAMWRPFTPKPMPKVVVSCLPGR